MSILHRRTVARFNAPVVILAFAALDAASQTAEAQNPAPAATELPPITVVGTKKAPAKKARERKPQAKAPPASQQTPPPGVTKGQSQTAAQLDTETTVGSLLGLTPRETPATVNVVTREEIEEKGARSLVEVYRTAPGVVSGNLPGEPGVTSMRGFSRAATGYSIDGSRAVDPLLISRDYDSFNFERIEVLKGPASVVHGTGALAGAINLVTRQASLGRAETEAMTSYGGFGTVRAGASANAPLGPDAAARATISYSRSDGYVDDTGSEKIAFTNNLMVRPTQDLTVSVSADFFRDDFRTPYQGAPLIARSLARDPTDLVSTPDGLVIDKALRDKNYNVEDGRMVSDALWLRSRADYKLTSNWTLRNELGFYTADRAWANSEDFTFNANTRVLDRTVTNITHDHQFWSERASLAYDGVVVGFRNRFVTGLEYIDTAFASKRRFGTTSPVDPFDPERGTFPADTPANFTTRVNFDSAVKTAAAFLEDAINLTPAWMLVGGVRYESTELDRSVDCLSEGEQPCPDQRFGRTFESPTWRIGSVYELAKGTSLFAQYTEAVIPVTTLLLSNIANAEFDLSTGQSVEAGVKSSFLGGRLVAIASVYQIDQDNILTQDPSNPSLRIQGGSQRSRGVEVEASLALTERWTVTASGSLIDAEFTSLRDPTGRDLTGNRPVNVPPYTWYLGSSYRLEGVPVTVGASLSGVGPFFTNETNTIEVNERALLDAWVAYDVGGGVLRVRGRNLTDEFYADWSGYSPSQVFLGAPRSFDVSYSIKW